MADHVATTLLLLNSNKRTLDNAAVAPPKRRVTGRPILMTANFYDVRTLSPLLELALCSVPPVGADGHPAAARHALDIVAELDVSSRASLAWTTLAAVLLDRVGLAHCDLWGHFNVLLARANHADTAAARSALLAAAYNVACAPKSSAARDAAHWALRSIVHECATPALPEVPCVLYTACARACGAFHVRNGGPTQVAHARNALYALCTALTEHNHGDAALACAHMSALAYEYGAHIEHNQHLTRWARGPIVSKYMPVLSDWLCNKHAVLWLHLLPVVVAAHHLYAHAACNALRRTRVLLALRLLDRLVELYVRTHSGVHGGSTNAALNRALFLSLPQNAVQLALATTAFWREHYLGNPHRVLHECTLPPPAAHVYEQHQQPSLAARTFRVPTALRTYGGNDEYCNELTLALELNERALEWPRRECAKSHGPSALASNQELAYSATQHCSSLAWSIASSSSSASSPIVEPESLLERVATAHLLAAAVTNFVAGPTDNVSPAKEPGHDDDDDQ